LTKTRLSLGLSCGDLFEISVQHYVVPNSTSFASAATIDVQPENAYRPLAV